MDLSESLLDNFSLKWWRDDAIPISNQSNLATKFFLLERIKRDKSVSQRLSNEFTAGLVSNVRKNLRTTYSLPRREGNRNEKTVCNTRYQPRNWRRGVERISWQDRHDRIRGGKTFKQSFFFFFSFFQRLVLRPSLFSFSSTSPPPFFSLFFVDYYCYATGLLALLRFFLPQTVCRNLMARGNWRIRPTLWNKEIEV